MEELGFELEVEVGLQKLCSCFTATISIAGASYCIFIVKKLIACLGPQRYAKKLNKYYICIMYHTISEGYMPFLGSHRPGPHPGPVVGCLPFFRPEFLMN
jgi:hypothetical protein